ncbi:hypothetical protein TNCV_2641631 [Trichonephila clavipes]|nr:hypothetical protein TNCV_2641631 [Trichonephila clavipes]
MREFAKDALTCVRKCGRPDILSLYDVIHLGMKSKTYSCLDQSFHQLNLIARVSTEKLMHFVVVANATCLTYDEAHFWLNGYVNKQNCRIWSEANPQVYVKTPLHPEKLTIWWALWAGGILLQKR